MTEYVEKILHVKIVHERHFLEINKSKAKNHTGLGWGIGVLLIAVTHSKLSYSYPLLMAVTHRSHGTSFNKLLYILRRSSKFTTPKSLVSSTWPCAPRLLGQKTSDIYSSRSRPILALCC